MNIAKEQAPLLPGRVPGFKRTDVRLLPCIFRWGFIFSLVCLLIVSLNKKKNQLEKEMHDIGINFHFLEVQDNDGKSSIKWSSLDGTFTIESLKQMTF